jgi:hypothetical protein
MRKRFAKVFWGDLGTGAEKGYGGSLLPTVAASVGVRMGLGGVRVSEWPFLDERGIGF